MLCAQSPLVPPDSPVVPRGMLTPLQKASESETADAKARIQSGGSNAAIQDLEFGFDPIDYFNREQHQPIVGTWYGASICNEMLSVERFLDSRNLDPQQTVHSPGDLHLPVGTLQPLIAPDLDASMPHQPFPEPERDTITSQMKTSSPIIDGQVQRVGFQEPAISKQDANSDSTQEASVSKQEPDTDEPTSSLVINGLSIEGLRKKVKDQIELVKSNETLDEQSKTNQLKQLDSASALVQKAAMLKDTIAQETRKKNEFDNDKQVLETKLVESSNPQSPDTNKTSKQLQLELQEKRRSEQAKKSERSSIDSQLENRDKRITELPGLRTAVQERQKLIKEQMATVQSQPDDIASSLVLSAKELAATLELNQIDVESARQDQLGVLLPLQKTLLSREITKLEMEIKAWETAYDASRKQEIEKQQEQALAARKKAIHADKALAKLAIENEKLAQKRSELTLMDHQCDERSAQTDARFNEIESTLTSVQGKVETSGRMTREHGIELIELRPSLMHMFESQARIEQITEELQEYRINGLNLKEESEKFTAPDVLIKNLIEQRGATNLTKTRPLLSDQEFEEMAAELIHTKLSYLKDLQNDYETLRTNLTHERDRLVKLSNKVREAFRYIDENALWVPSANPISFADLARSRNAARSFFDSGQWLELVGYTKARMIKRPYESALAGFIMLAIAVVTRRLRGSA